MKKIYFVQANAVYGDTVKSTYIPYAAGCIVSYAFSHEKIREEYTFERFIYTREDIKQAAASIEGPCIIGFSSSIWNNEYNKALARAIKEKFPDCITVFGGHQIPPSAKKAFSEYTDADILIHGGGEEAFSEILLHLCENRPLTDIDNISVKMPDGTIYDGKRVNPSTPDYPSPYLTGTFDSILDDGYDFSAIIETNRGCPNSCAFCDWGILRSKVRQFDLQKVYDELQWLAEKKIEYVYCADANFGLFDRDMDITDKFIELKNRYGYPKKLKVNFTKNRCEFVGDISRKLSENDMGKSQTLSFQSVDEAVLSAIGRKNIDLPYFRKLLTMYADDGIPTYSELILGLPCETYESFTKGLCTLIEHGQHKSINIYPCELLPNSKLGSEEFAEKYRIKTTRLPFLQFHCKKETSGVTEYSNLITSTSTMSREAWVDSYFFATLIQSFHCLDITREIAIFMRTLHNVSYNDFYKKLLEYVSSSRKSTLNNIFTRIRNHIDGISLAENPIGFYDERFGKISYEPDEHMFLSCVCESERVYDEIKAFLLTLLPEEDALPLIAYQKSLLYLPGKQESTICTSFDYPGFFEKAEKGETAELKQRETKIRLSIPSEASSWEQYARECVWYGRRNEGMHMKINLID